MQAANRTGRARARPFFALLGLLWIVAAARMPLWQGFIPQSGFMPLWYGITLTGLAAAILANLSLRKAARRPEEPVGKPLVVIAVFAAAVRRLRA